MKEELIREMNACYQPGKHVHIVGIGGVSMRALAVILHNKGLKVTGSDVTATRFTEELEEMGIPVEIGHRAENIAGADCLLRTAAAHDDNPEVKAARAAGISVFERADTLGLLMKDYENAICVAGTHGKTTTTGMLTHIFMEAGRDPTVLIGGYMPLLDASHRVGKSSTMIAESCEYYNSFLSFFPTVAIINNIEEEHLDFFRDLDQIKDTFRKFAEMVPARGMVIINGDDANTVDAMKGLPCKTFGLGKQNDIHPEEVSEDWRHCKVYCDGELYCELSIPNYGKFNLTNAIGACAVAWQQGIDGETAARGIAGYKSVGRRQQVLGHCNGADVYDDYAHHPTEVKSLIAGIRTMGYKRVVVAYQPFTFSRAATLFDKFVDALSTADILVMAEIHPARETNTYGIHSYDIAAKIPGAVYYKTVPEVADFLRRVARPGDAVLTTGGGPIVNAGTSICDPQQ